MADYRDAAVTEDLRPLFSRVAARRVIDGDQDLVDGLPPVQHHGVPNGVTRRGLEVRRAAQERREGAQGTGA